MSRVVSYEQLEVLQFNDEQLAKVGAALQAMADQMSTNNESMTENVIDLLSDSDFEDENTKKSDILPQVQGQADESRIQNNYSEITPGTLDVHSVQEREGAYKPFPWHKSNVPYPNVSVNIGCAGEISQPEAFETSAALTVSSESLNVQNNFNDDAVEPNIEEKSIKGNQHPRPERFTYFTLTDFTREQIQVKEMHVISLLYNRKDVLTSPETTVKIQQTFLQENELVNEEWLKEEKPEFQTDQANMQPFYEKEKGSLRLGAYPNVDSVYSLNSREDSNGNSAVFGTDIMDIDNVSDDNAAELSDHSTKQILIDLVDSETEDEQETGECREVDVSKTTHRSNNSSIDCFMMYSCPECGLECGSASDWKLHTDTEHKFATIGALNMQTIIDKAGHICYQCRDCALKFELHKNFYKLLSHRISHLPNENYVRCRICDMSFRNKSYIRRHLSKMHYKICRDYLQKGKRPNAYAIEYVKITCPMCNQHIANRKQWHDHLEDSHDFSRICMSQVSLISKDVYGCTICGVKLRKRSVPEHMLAHEKTKSFACTYCNKYEASHIGMALKHVRRVHLMPANESIFKCKYCGETFQKMSVRKNHMRQEHKVKRPKCSICDKEFFSISLLFSHMNFANHHELK